MIGKGYGPREPESPTEIILKSLYLGALAIGPHPFGVAGFPQGSGEPSRERPVSKCPTDLAPTLRASSKARHAQPTSVVLFCPAGNSTCTVFLELWREGEKAGVTLPFFFSVWPNHMAYGSLASQAGIKARCPILKALRPKHWATREFPCSHF